MFVRHCAGATHVLCSVCLCVRGLGCISYQCVACCDKGRALLLTLLRTAFRGYVE